MSTDVDIPVPQLDLLSLVEKLYIVDKSLGVKQFRDIMHPAQRDIIRQVERCINTRTPCRIIVLKARQIGMSTVIEAIQFLLAKMLPRMQGLVIAHENDSSEHLLAMQQHYFDTFFAKDAYTQKNKSAKVLSWVETGSSIRIATAKNTGAGRSKTLQFLHGSEVAFWDNADMLMTGLAQTIPLLPNTFIFLESTANGIGNYFYNIWEDSCNGEIDYLPRFYPWWTHPEYLGSKLQLPPLTGHLDEDERKLVQLLSDPPKARWNDYEQLPLSNDEILDRLVWRRYALRNLCKGDLNKFHQEYPSTPDEAFISTGTNVFSLESLDKCFVENDARIGEVRREGEKVRFQASIEGHMKIFVEPKPGRKYVVAGDPKRAVEGDYCAIQVIDRRSWEQVATYRSKLDPVSFGEVMMNIGKYYNTALLVNELEGGGYGTIAVIQDRGYPFIWQHQKAEKMLGQPDTTFGWHTNWKTKSEALGNLVKALIDDMITFHDRDTYTELKNYVSLPGGKFGNGNSVDHDDLVMALAIGITVTMYEMAEMINEQAMEPAVFVPPELKRRPKRATLEELLDSGNERPGWMDWNEEN